MHPSRPVVAVIHANPATMQPVVSAFAERFPGADLWHLLDDRLVTDAERAGGLTPELRDRMTTLIEYAVANGARAVQLACSMYGPAAADASQRHPIPVLASDQAMFDEVARTRRARVAILASLHPAAKDSAERLAAALAEQGQHPIIDTLVVEEAMDAAKAGDRERLARVLAEGAASLADDVDVVVLAQYSLAPVAAAVADAVRRPVLSGPHLAADVLASRLGETDK
jgi:hypothetical protein